MYEELEEAEKTLTLMDKDHLWLTMGLIASFGLIVLAGVIFLMIKFPSVMIPLTVLILTPFGIGYGIRQHQVRKINKLKKLINTKDAAVEL